MLPLALNPGTWDVDTGDFCGFEYRRVDVASPKPARTTK